MGNENTVNETDDYKCLICGNTASQGIEAPIAKEGKILIVFRVCKEHPQKEGLDALIKASQEFIKNETLKSN